MVRWNCLGCGLGGMEALSSLPPTSEPFILAPALAALAVLTHSATALPADLDLTFNGTGQVATTVGPESGGATCVAIQGDGKIVLAGGVSNGTNTDFAVIRYNTNGSLDTSFGGTGKVTTDIGNGDDTCTSIALLTLLVQPLLLHAHCMQDGKRNCFQNQ